MNGSSAYGLHVAGVEDPVERPAVTQSSVQQVRRLAAAHARREIGQGALRLDEEKRAWLGCDLKKLG
jgi:hypothetical protein